MELSSAEYEVVPETLEGDWHRYNIDCVLCRRLVAHTQHVRRIEEAQKEVEGQGVRVQ